MIVASFSGRALHYMGLLSTPLVMTAAVALAQRPAQGPPAANPPHAAVALQGVTVVDVETGRRTPDQTILVVGNRIEARSRSRASGTCTSTRR